MNDAASYLPLVLLAIIFVVLVVRPARARRRQFDDLQSRLNVGQEIMLASGIYGVIETIDEEKIGLLIAPGVVVDVNRHAVSRVIPVEGPADESIEPGSED